MKKSTLLLLTALSLVLSSQLTTAQNSVFFPNKGGISMMSTSTGLLFEHNYGSGLNDVLYTPKVSLALEGEWILSKEKSNFLSVELVYSFQGQKYADWKPDFQIPGTIVYFTKDVNLNYIKLPLSYKKVYTDENKCLKYFYRVGVYAAYLQKADLLHIRRGKQVTFLEAMTEKNPHASEMTQPNAFKDLYKNMDAGLVLGWGGQQSISDKLTLGLEARSEFGFIDINAKDWQFTHPLLGYRSTFNMLMGLKFSLLYDLK